MPRQALGAIALSAAASLGLALLVASLRRVAASGVRAPDDLVTLGVLAAGALVLAWYLATALAALTCLAARAAGRAWVAGERRVSRCGAPLARRLLLIGGGAAVVAAAALSPAVAAPMPADLGPAVTVADDLGWGAADHASTTPSDDEPDGQQPEPEPEHESGPESWPESESESDSDSESESEVDPASSTAPSETYTVSPGDSLWTIAAHHLPAGSSAIDIAAAWPAWYAENSLTLGDDPDLIHPGQVLHAPDHDLEEHA